MAGPPSEHEDRRSLVGGVVGRVVPAVLRQVDTNDLIRHLDVNAIAAELDLDALVARLDVNAIAAELDLDALMARIDMAQLTAGATQDVAVSGLDLVRRQLVRLDVTVEATVDRVLHRRTGRPAAPGALTDVAGGMPAGPEEAELRRRDVSGHYAGPVTRGLTLAGDVFGVLASFSVLTGLILTMLTHLFALEVTISSGGWLSRGLFIAWGLLWFAVPVAAFGRTPLMAVSGLAVIDRHGGPVRLWRATVRAAVIPVAILMLMIGLIGMVVGRERRTLYDVAANTIVVYDWGPRQAEQPVTIRDQLSARVRRRQRADVGNRGNELPPS